MIGEHSVLDLIQCWTSGRGFKSLGLGEKELNKASDALLMMPFLWFLGDQKHMKEPGSRSWSNLGRFLIVLEFLTFVVHLGGWGEHFQFYFNQSLVPKREAEKLLRKAAGHKASSIFISLDQELTQAAQAFTNWRLIGYLATVCIECIYDL